MTLKFCPKKKRSGKKEVRKMISEYRFDFNTEKTVTMSCGLFECQTRTYTIEDVFTNADSALYYAKEHGRNQLIVYNEIEKEA